MRRLLPFACAAALLAGIFLLAAPRATFAKDKPRKPTPALPAALYPLHETHDTEHVTVAVEPGDIDSAIPKTRLDYAHHGFLPFRIIIANNGDQPLSLDNARLHFIAADNTVVPAADDDDLQRRMFSQKSVAGTKIPLPAPLPGITIHHPPVDKQILADDADFGFPSTTIAPHTESSGYLFYDTRNVDEPALEHATFEVRRMEIDGKPIFSFNIPLKPSPAPVEKKAEEKAAH